MDKETKTEKPLSLDEELEQEANEAINNFHNSQEFQGNYIFNKDVSKLLVEFAKSDIARKIHCEGMYSKQQLKFNK